MPDIIDVLMDIIEVCESKINPAIQRLSELEVDDPKFTTTITNLEKCLTMSQSYKSLLMKHAKFNEEKGEENNATNN